VKAKFRGARRVDAFFGGPVNRDGDSNPPGCPDES
jgi:hypothetical protein